MKALPSETIFVDPGALLARLLLFETYVVDSFGMGEVPDIVNLLGFDGTMDLLESGALRFSAFRLLAASLDGSRLNLKMDPGTNPSRPGHFAITNVTIDTPEHAHSECLEIVKRLSHLSHSQRMDLQQRLRTALVPIPENYGLSSTAQTHRELDRDTSSLARACAHVLSMRLDRLVKPKEIKLEVEREG